MVERLKTSPQVYARTGGVLYLIIIVIGTLAELSRDQLTVSGNAAATAANIMGSESLFRLGLAGEVVMLICAIPLALIVYVLLRPVSNTLALLTAFFNLISIAVEAVMRLTLFGVLLASSHALYLKAFTPNQLHTLAYLGLRLYDYGFGLSLTFFACFLLIVGYLIFRSGFFPRTIGVLLILASLAYFINSFTLFLAPAYAAVIFPILILAFIGEASFCLWLLVMGVNVAKWEAAAAAA
jgi:hypothetical protein